MESEDRAVRKEGLKRFISLIVSRFSSAETSTQAVVIAYYLLLALFPTLIALGNLLPYFNIDPVGVISYLNTVVPKEILSVLDPAIRGVLTTGNSGLLIFGIALGVWSASRSITHMRRGLNRAYGVTDSGGFIVKRLLSIITVLFMMLLLVAFVLLFSFGDSLQAALEPVFPWVSTVFRWVRDLKWPVTILFMFLLLAMVYWVMPSVKQRLRNALPGAALSTVGLLLLAQVFTVYLRFSSKKFSGYGALGIFFALMFWLHFSAIIVLAGGVLNACIQEFRYGKPVELNRMNAMLQKTRRSLAARRKKKEPQKEDPPKDDPPA